MKRPKKPSDATRSAGSFTSSPTASAGCSSFATAWPASTPRTLDEVGRAFSVTRERVRQIEYQSLRKLQTLAESQKLRGVA